MTSSFNDLTKDGKIFIDELNKIRLANPGKFKLINQIF